MNDKNDEIIRLLKHGRSEDVRMYVDAQKKESYPEDFTVFMNQMLDEYHMKKKEVAVRSGLSQDYTYKLLNGNKKTKERDYILAICIAVGMNISQTQHALAIYGMPMLNRSDLRSNVIYLGIEHHLDIDGINQWLEKSGFVYIKTSPDMPSAIIEIRGDGIIEAPVSRARHNYEEIDRQIEAEHCGNAPMDYNYWGIINIQDEEGKKYSVQAAYTMEGDHLIVLDEENYQKSLESLQRQDQIDRDFFEKYPELKQNPMWPVDHPELFQEFTVLHENNPQPDILEEYNSLLEAAGSDFFRFFLELDHATDEKVVQTMKFIDDTRNYGTRIGAGIIGGKKLCYLETFNGHNPAEREYLQIVQVDGECTYTASHESYFMRIELGEMYSMYFGEQREPEYYISAKDTIEFSGKDIRLRFIFDDLRLSMFQYAKQNFQGLIDTDDEELNEQMIRALIQRATWFRQGEKYEETLSLLQQAVSMMEEAEARGLDYSISLIITYSKIANTFGMLGDLESLFDTYEVVYQMKDRTQKLIEEDDDALENALSSLADAMVYKAQRCQNLRGQYDPEAKTLAKEAIDILEGRCTQEGSYAILFLAYTKYAYIIDVDEPELAVRYCRKAAAIVNAFHLDQNPEYQDQVVTMYNNYAWVLWNKLESEEAVIYYGRAIELLEGFLFTGSQPEEEVLASLNHIGEALYQLYMATGKEKEAGILKERLAENHVDL